MLQLFRIITIWLLKQSHFAVFKYLQNFSSDIALYTLSGMTVSLKCRHRLLSKVLNDQVM
jgi:hypothetical protein